MHCLDCFFLIVFFSNPDIPHFKQVVLMSFVCDFCGFKSNEVKSGSGTSELGTRITLHLTDTTDLSRDILKVNCVHEGTVFPQINAQVFIP